MPTAKKTVKLVKKTVKKVEVKASVKPVSKSSGLTVDSYGITGKIVGKVELPKEIFQAKINNQLMAQAVRIYLANHRQGTSSTKTRGEVEGSTRKIWRQKGTGRARHGGIRAPIFVGGGIAFGPKPRDYSLKLPQKMRKAAVISALSTKFKDGEIKVLSGFEKIEPKTKNMALFVKSVSPKSGKTLLITSGAPKEGLENLYRASRNLKDVEILSVNLLNTYEILNNNQILLMKQAVDVMSKNLSGKETK